MVGSRPMIRAAQKSVVAVAAVLGVLLGVALFSQLSCATADFKDVSDSGQVKECRQGPLVFCEAGANDARSCIVTATETDARLKLLTPGKYPDKCVVNYLARGHDVNGECILAAVCKCQDTDYDAAAPPEFVCGP
jgi:hypothetical protein